MMSRILRATRSAGDRGASAVEYGLLVAAIAAVISSTVFGAGHVINNNFHRTYRGYSCAAARSGGPPSPGCPRPGR